MFVAGDFHDRTPPGTVQVLTPSNQATPQLSDPSQSDKVNYAVPDSDVGGAADSMVEEQKDLDPLDKFLPPPPKVKCSEELQVSSVQPLLVLIEVNLFIFLLSSTELFFCICYFVIKYKHIYFCLNCLLYFIFFVDCHLFLVLSCVMVVYNRTGNSEL